MKHPRMAACWMACVLGVAARPATGLETAEGIRFEARPPVHIRLSGDTNLSRWEMLGTEIRGFIETGRPREDIESAWEALRETDAPVATGPPSLDDPPPVRIAFTVPAQSFEGRHPGMKRNLLEAIRAKEHPLISYEFIELTAAPVLAGDADALIMEVQARGRLTLAGRTNPVRHTTRIQARHFSHIELSGRLALNMSDFGVAPPVAVFGLIRANPDFEVSYRFIAGIPAPPDSGGQNRGFHE